MANNMGENSGMALHSYSKTQPPGWRAGLADYPLKRYLELLELWMATTDLEEKNIGPAVAGRLGGRVQTLAINLIITMSGQLILRGVAALSFQGEPAD